MTEPPDPAQPAPRRRGSRIDIRRPAGVDLSDDAAWARFTEEAWRSIDAWRRRELEQAPSPQGEEDPRPE